MRPNPITPTIPLDKVGKHHGFLRLPYSRDDSGLGSVMIPLTVIRNGDGPTALLTGGNHGDEYEGPIALQDLALSLEPDQVQGSVIIIPAMNYPAFRVGRRTSPIDHGNLNRLFPGRPDGTITEKIADYFQRTLLPMADYVLDYHSGGRTMDFLPAATAHFQTDKTREQACLAAMKAFGAPYSMMLLEIDGAGLYDTAAEDMGKVFISTELGGGGTSTAHMLRIAKKGLRNFLAHAGILDEEVEVTESTTLDMPDGDCYVFSENDGMLEPTVDMGEMVKAGQVVARVWPLDRTGVEPTLYRAKRDGLLAARHFPGHVQTGDCMAIVAVVG